MKVFRKTGVSTLINILGMSVAFAAAMILMVQVKWDSTYDKNFEGHEKVFRMENNWMDDGLFYTGISRPIIELIRTASPNLEAVGTLKEGGQQVFYKEGDKESAITIPYAQIDSSMLSVFPFEWVEGSAKEFTTRGTAILNEAFAQMIFGEESAVGKLLLTGDSDQYRIIGVFKNTPRNYSMHYGIIANMGDWFLHEGNEWSFSAYLKLYNPAQVRETESAILDALAPDLFEGSSDEEIAKYRKGFRLSNLHDAHFERDVRANIASANKSITISLAAIAILILIAIINFINFAFAEIPFRIKSINTRKVLGEGRGSLIGRQIVNAGIIALVAFALACLIVHVVSGTSLASYVSDSIALKENIGILAITLGVALLSAVAAGIAPALYSTSQPAALVLKGSYGTSVRGRSLRNALVALQFILSFVFILMALVWCGYYAGGAHNAVHDKLLQNPSIVDVTFSDNLIVSDQKMGWGRTGDDGKQVFMEVLPVTDDFVRFFGLQIVEGRDFQESDNQSETGCFIANETFIQSFPQYHVGSLVGGHVDNTEIVGIVKDFNFKSLKHPMGPLVLLNWGKTQWRNFSVMYVSRGRL